MTICTCIFTLALTTYCINMAISERPTEQQASDRDNNQATNGIGTDDAWGRDVRDNTIRRDLRKRSANLAAKGLAAIEKLLTGARKTYTSKNARFYRKTGTSQTALDDFNSVEPVMYKGSPNRPHFGRSRVRYAGRVGDRTVIIMLDGDRKSGNLPVLEIRSATNALYDRIVYHIE